MERVQANCNTIAYPDLDPCGYGLHVCIPLGLRQSPYTFSETTHWWLRTGDLSTLSEIFTTNNTYTMQYLKQINSNFFLMHTLKGSALFLGEVLSRSNVLPHSRGHSSLLLYMDAFKILTYLNHYLLNKFYLSFLGNMIILNFWAKRSQQELKNGVEWWTSKTWGTDRHQVPHRLGKG